MSLGQGTIEQILLNYLMVNTDLVVEWNTVLGTLGYSDESCENDSAHPIKAQTRKSEKSHPYPEEEEVVRARFLVGCDGGRSMVRRQLGIQLEGDRLRQHFGVMDIVPLTDFRA